MARTPNQKTLNQRRSAYFRLIRTMSHGVVKSDAEAQQVLASATTPEQRPIAGAIFAKRKLDARIRVLIGKGRVADAEKELNEVHRILLEYGTCKRGDLNAIAKEYRRVR